MCEKEDCFRVERGKLARDIMRARFSIFFRPCSQTCSPIRKSTICWNTYVRIYTAVMPLKHAESRAIQPLFRRYRVWRCSPLFPSVAFGKGRRAVVVRFRRKRSHERARAAISRSVDNTVSMAR